MADEAQRIGHELLETGTLVSFRIVAQDVLSAADEAEFGLQLQLKFVADEGEHDLDEDDAAEDTAEWGALGFMLALGVLSFADAKPREASVLDYVAGDGFKLADFIERLRFIRGELHFDADYIRGRRIKTRIIVRSNGTVTLETIGRGKAASRWLAQLQEKSSCRSLTCEAVVGCPPAIVGVGRMSGIARRRKSLLGCRRVIEPHRRAREHRDRSQR